MKHGRRSKGEIRKGKGDCSQVAAGHGEVHVQCDGILQGPSLEATAALAEQVSIPLIASGGVSSLDDIAALLQIAPLGVAGAIIGRALYDGRVDPASATTLVRPAEDAAC